MRLNKYISDTGLCSRREADQCILQGRVTINGQVAGLGSRVQPGDEVCVDHAPVLFAPGPHGRHLRSTSEVNARDIARHKARSLAHYFQKFANGPLERAAAAVSGWVLIRVVGR